MPATLELPSAGQPEQGERNIEALAQQLGAPALRRSSELNVDHFTEEGAQEGSDEFKTYVDGADAHSEGAEQAERSVEAAAQQLGAIAAHTGEVTVEMPTEKEIKEGIEALEAYANGADVRNDDEGRMHDIEAAYEAAKIENEIFNIYDQAQKENEMVNAHQEALEENKQHDIKFAELKASDAQQQPTAEEIRQTQAAEAVEAAKDARLQAAQTEARKADSVDYKVQAEAALKQAGYSAEIPTGSQITKDTKTGDILIAHDNDVRVLKPQLDGSAPKVVDYHFDTETQVLTIRDQGNVMLARVGNYVRSQVPEGKEPEEDSIELPPAVKQIVGFDRATPVSIAE